MAAEASLSPASLRWALLRRALLPSSSSSSSSNSNGVLELITRKATLGFNLIPWEIISNTTTHRGEAEEKEEEAGGCISQQQWKNSNSKQYQTTDIGGDNDTLITYTLPPLAGPTSPAAALSLMQRTNLHTDLNDFEVSSANQVDTTGLVCLWPSEDILAYYCLTHGEMFRSKRIIELGSGYGLAGLVVAASTDADEVVISDGNPQVVDYMQYNIHANSQSFQNTRVNTLRLHWSKEPAADLSNHFDIIIASDCTFFKEFHADLVHLMRSLLKRSEDSEAIFFSPRRGNTLDMFLVQVLKAGLRYEKIEEYDSQVYSLHQRFQNGDNSSWPNYDADHCYPLMIRIRF